MPSFNLADQPWIPCLMMDGAAQDLSLREALLRAPEVRELFDPSPLVTASLHRLLLAVLHAAYGGPKDMEAWAAIWNANGFDAAKVESYFDRWRGRFDLFDPQRPFYQRIDMENVKNLSSVLRLVHDSAAANSNSFWDHTAGEDAAISPSAAARALIATQGYAFAGGVNFPIRFYDAPHMRGFTVLARGTNLFETLALNLVVYNQRTPIARTGDDLPIWEQDHFATPETAGTNPRGYLDFLTFQARAVWLIPRTDGLVSQCYFRMNLVLKDEQALDPFKAYRKDDKLGLRPLVFSVGRGVWRDSYTLFATTATTSRPRVLDHLAEIDQLRDDGDIEAERAYAADVLGMCTEPGKAIVHYWRQERLPLPLVYLREQALQLALKKALDAANAGLSALRGAINWLARLTLQPRFGEAGAGAPDPKTMKGLANSFDADLIYWRQLDLDFAPFLERLAEDVELIDEKPSYGATALPAWAEMVRSAAWAAFQSAANTLDLSTRSLRAAAEAEQRLNIGLASAVKEIRRGERVPT